MISRIEWIEEHIEDGLVLPDRYNHAIIGICYSFGGENKTAYDLDKVIKVLVEEDGMTNEEAEEFFDFNILGSYVGETTPVYIRTYDGPENTKAY